MADTRQFVVFKTADELYGVPIHQVREIIIYVKPTPIPELNGSIRGIINLRGNVIYVVDIRSRLGFAEANDNQNSRIMIFDLDGYQIGAIVDSVAEVLTIEEGGIENIGANMSVGSANTRSCMEGVAKVDGNLIILLDGQKLLESIKADNVLA